PRRAGARPGWPAPPRGAGRAGPVGSARGAALVPRRAVPPLSRGAGRPDVGWAPAGRRRHDAGTGRHATGYHATVASRGGRTARGAAGRAAPPGERHRPGAAPRGRPASRTAGPGTAAGAAGPPVDLAGGRDRP